MLTRNNISEVLCVGRCSKHNAFIGTRGMVISSRDDLAALHDDVLPVL